MLRFPVRDRIDGVKVVPSANRCCRSRTAQNTSGAGADGKACAEIEDVNRSFDDEGAAYAHIQRILELEQGRVYAQRDRSSAAAEIRPWKLMAAEDSTCPASSKASAVPSPRIMNAPKAAMSMLPAIVSLGPDVAVQTTLTTIRRHVQF